MDTERGDRVFLVRMWRRPVESTGTDSGWRGSIAEIGTEARYYVTGARDVADFIDLRLGVEPESKREA